MGAHCDSEESMSKLSKKALFVKRSNAAKKGWATRRDKQQSNQSQRTSRDKAPSRGAKPAKKSGPRPNAGRQPKRAKVTRSSKSNTRASVHSAKDKKIARLEKENTRLRKAQQKEQSRDRAAIRKAGKEALKSVETLEKTIANMARNGVPIRTILKQIPESGHEHAKKVIVQTRLDMSASMYEDVRWEAFDLADELDWDISDVFDAWDYDEGAVA